MKNLLPRLRAVACAGALFALASCTTSFDPPVPGGGGSAIAGGGAGTASNGAGSGSSNGPGQFGEPVVLTDAQTAPHDIAVDASGVFWIDRGRGEDNASVRTVPHAGGASQEIQSNQTDAHGIALDGARVFWTARYSPGGWTNVYACPKGGGGDTSVFRDDDDAFLALAVQGSLFAVTSTDGKVGRGNTAGAGECPTDPAACSTWVAERQGATLPAVVIDAGTLYWVSASLGEVRRRSVTQTEVFAAEPAGPSDVAVDASHVYWTSNDDGTVKALAKTAALETPTVLATGTASPRGIAVDDDYVYWASTGDRRVLAVPKHGGNVVTLWEGQDQPYDVASYQNAVYFTTQGAGAAVMRVDKIPGR